MKEFIILVLACLVAATSRCQCRCGQLAAAAGTLSRAGTYGQNALMLQELLIEDGQGMRSKPQPQKSPRHRPCATLANSFAPDSMTKKCTTGTS